MDRVGVDGFLSELDEYAVEQALQIKEKASGGDGADEATVAALCVGPEKVVDAVRKALQLGADKGVHVVDDAIAGTDAGATSLVLAKAIAKLVPRACESLTFVGTYVSLVSQIAETLMRHTQRRPYDGIEG